MSAVERPIRPWREPPRLVAAAILLVGAAVSLALNLPGHFSYDSIVQLAEGRGGVYTGEHPPVMSWLLGLADALTPGAPLFVVFDTGLITAALLALVLIAPRVSWLATPVAAVSVCLPQLALYPGIVWKDVLFAGACAAGFACLAWAVRGRAQPRRRRLLAAAALLLLLTLAALARQNGAVVLPFAAAAVGWAGWRQDRTLLRAAAHGLGFLAASVVLYVAATAALATRLESTDGNAEAWTALQTYDLVGAAARQPTLELAVLRAGDPRLRSLILTTGAPVYSPARIDSILPVLDHMDRAGADAAPVAAQWRALILHDPLLYLRIRATTFGWVLLTPDAKTCVLAFTGVSGPPEEMAQSGLKPRRTAWDVSLAAYALGFAGTPASSHTAYAALGLGLLALLLRRRRGSDIAVAAMLGAALAFAGSFAIISIACDYRYLYDLDIAVIAAALYAAAGFRAPSRQSPETSTGVGLLGLSER